MKLLLYSRKDEPVTNILLDQATELGIKTLSTQELLDAGEIFDEVNEKETKICWYHPKLGTITNSPTTKVINRALGVDTNCVKQFSKSDREYAKSEYWAYLNFALNEFPKITEKPGFGSLAGGCYSLPHQWQIVSRSGVEIATPKFFIGPSKFMPLSFQKKAIYTNPYHFYSWKPNNAPQEKESGVFAIKRPPGIPILLLMTGTCELLSRLDKDEEKPIPEREIKILGRKIHHLFNFFISEILLFFHHSMITFCMITNTPVAGYRSLEFRKAIVDAGINF